MDRRVVIIGGSIAGLGAGVALARRGWSVTIIERDGGPPTTSGDEAFLAWDHRNVPQFRQPHGFGARSRNLLLEHAPEVVEQLGADGIETSNFLKLMAPRELWEPDDDRFDGFIVRRPAFELAMRLVAEAEPNITFVCPANASGLVFRDRVNAGDPPVVAGVRLADGTAIDADIVLDCGGRRTLVPGWLAAAGSEIPYESQDCDVTYFTRYYRLRPESQMDPVFVVAVGSEVVNAAAALAFPGDHDSFAIGLAASPTDDALSVLRHNWAFDAVAHLMPGITPWIDESNATPINDVAVMSGQRNIRRHFVVDGKPAALGVLPVGDSLCTTNPTYGWGASMALTYAFEAVRAIVDHGDDLEATALAYDAAAGPEADAVYSESAAMDRLRIYRWRGTEIPDHDVAEMQRQDLIARGVQRGATRDLVLGRAFLRRSNLIDRPSAVLDRPEVMERAEAMYAKSVQRDADAKALTREDVLAVIAAAAPPDKEPAPV